MSSAMLEKIELLKVYWTHIPGLLSHFWALVAGMALFSYLLGSIPFGFILTQRFLGKDIRNVGSGNIGATNVLRLGHKKMAALTLILDFFKGFLAFVCVKQFVASDAYLNYFGRVIRPFLQTLHLSNWERYEVFMANNDSLVFLLLTVSACCAILGHIYPLWLRFKGGKGVATAAGILFGFSWSLGLLIALVWGLAILVGRISSLASLIAVFLLPFFILMLFFKGSEWIEFLHMFYFLPFLGDYLDHLPLSWSFSLWAVFILILIFYKHKENIVRLSQGKEPKIGQSTVNGA